VAEPQATRVTLARILRPRGRIGEVAAEILTDFPDHLTCLSSVELWDGKNPPRNATIIDSWLHNGQAILHFVDCNTITAAEKLVGMEVQIPLEERLPLAPGKYYVTDLIGCEVFDAASAKKIGDVRDVQITGEDVAGTPNLVVDSPQGELLVPLATEICTRISTAALRIEVSLPEGLRDLNRR
jgi:16S rRNA processing protein RimM